MNKIGDKPRFEVTEADLIQFGNNLIIWLTETDDSGCPSDNFLYSEYCQQNAIFEDDIDYFINRYDAFFQLMKRAEEIQRTKIKGFAASGNIQAQIAKRMLAEKRRIIKTERAKSAANLKPKQATFCREYIIDHNGTQAAIRSGYSSKTAYSIAENLLRKVEIQSRISELESESLKRNEITKDMIVAEMAKLAFSNAKDYVGRGNEVEDISLMDRDKAAAIKKIKTTKKEIIIEGERIGDEVKTEIELIDKKSALDSLHKMCGYDNPIKIEQKTLTSTIVMNVIDCEIPLAESEDEVVK